jgi:hypothetical protein
MLCDGSPTTLDALSTHSPLVRIVDGRFQEKERRRRSCGHRWTVFEEKETDVNIAIGLVEGRGRGPLRHRHPGVGRQRSR